MTSQELVQQQRDLVAFADDDRLHQELAEILPPEISVPVFIRGLKNAMLANPDVMRADHPSIYRSVLRAGMDGLIPDGREAAIVVFGNQAAYMPMVGGLRKIAAEHGWALVAHCVYEQDGFDPDLEAHKANHKPPRLGTERGPLIGAYAIAEHRDGRRIGPEVMDKNEIDKVKNVSRAKGSGPWRDWYERMAEKTVARKLFKSLPLDPKDAERVNRILAVGEMNGDDAIHRLYGDRPDVAPQGPAVPEAAGDGGVPQPPSPPPNMDPKTGEILDDSDLPEFGEPEFVGEEPPDETPVEDAEIEIVEEPTFGGKKHAGKTVQQVWDEGDHGYVRWARRNWLTGDIVGALEAFAQDHPEIDE